MPASPGRCTSEHLLARSLYGLHAATIQLWISLHTANSPLGTRFDDRLRFLLRHRSVKQVGHRYQPGGLDQTSFEIPATDAQSFLCDSDVLRAIRLLNLRLMQKGPCNFGRYHCLDLADRLIGMESVGHD